MSNVKRERTGKTEIVELVGDLTLDRTAELRSALLAALGRADRIVLNLCGVGEIDAAGLQVLCAAHRTAGGAGKTITVSETCRDTLHSWVRRIGLSHASGCADGCIWTGS